VESSCEFGIEPSDFIKFWETIGWLHNLSSGAQLDRVNSPVMNFLICVKFVFSIINIRYLQQIEMSAFLMPLILIVLLDSDCV
jgi:hypothetical protein